MQNNINYSYNTNFKGAFLINFKKYPANMRQHFEKSMGKVKGQVFENFRDIDGDILYVLRNSKDYHAAHFIKTNELKFHYFPDVNSSLRFDEDKPSSVINYIDKYKPKVIHNLSKLMEYINEHRTKCKSDKDSHIGIIDKILKNCKTEMDGKKVRNKNGVTLIKDSGGIGFIKISPSNNQGTRFVILQPANHHENQKLYAVDNGGNILHTFDSADAILEFKKQFIKAISEHLTSQ